MSAPDVGVCNNWITSEDLLGGCCPLLSPEVDPQTVENAITIATNLLFRLSGRQFPGLCELTVRPCSSSGCNGCANGGWWAGAGWSSWWWNSAVGSWSVAYPFTSAELLNGLCGCAGRCELSSVILPNPVASVSEVVINGEVLASSAYRVVNFRRLERIDGGHLPCSQDFTRDSAPDSSDANGTWQVTFQFGRGPGADGEIMCQLLACQFALGLCGSDGCVLPERTSRIVREGVTMELIDMTQLMNDGLTGLPMVDQWLRSVNPAGIQRRAHFRRLGDARNNYQTST